MKQRPLTQQQMQKIATMCDVGLISMIRTGMMIGNARGVLMVLYLIIGITFCHGMMCVIMDMYH